MDREQIEIWVPANLANRLEKASVKAGFHSRGDFILFMLQQLFAEETEEMDIKENRLIEKRLRELGYF
jgi:metal-responsive CopG/Arc/MetJ family transcriptional regulator